MTGSGSENRASTRGPGGWLTRLAAGAALLALIGVGAEATVRVEDWIQYGTPLQSGATAVSDLSVADATGRHPAAGSSFRKWHINSLGTRGPEPDPAQRDHRVLLLGASESFGLYESPGQEFARQLADSLRAAGCPADVLNAAFPGMSLPTVEQDLRLRLDTTGARVAIYYPTPPQYVDDVPPQPVRRNPKGDGTLHLSPWRSRFLVRARDGIKGMLPRGLQDVLRQRDIASARARWSADSLYRTVPEDRLSQFDADLRHLVGTMKSLGMRPVLVTHANAFLGAHPAADDRLRAWERFYPRATGATLVAFDSAANTRIRRIAEDSGAVLVDAWAGFHAHVADSVFADFSHFTDRGAATMASFLRPGVSKALGCR